MEAHLCAVGLLHHKIPDGSPTNQIGASPHYVRVVTLVVVSALNRLASDHRHPKPDHAYHHVVVERREHDFPRPLLVSVLHKPVGHARFALRHPDLKKGSAWILKICENNLSAKMSGAYDSKKCRTHHKCISFGSRF